MTCQYYQAQRFYNYTSHDFKGFVRQLTRGIPSLVPVPINMTSDCSDDNCEPASVVAEPVIHRKITTELI